jgi:glycosyltransferase involved in cell wall biosynthesis
MTKGLVSVIIPNYNHARYLVQRIDSVINQTYKSLEVIILDDCSTDNSKDVIEKYRAHPLVKQIVYNTRNTGSPFLQWKKGVELAAGEWIWIAESDDYADPVFVETMLSSISVSQSYGLLYCDSYITINDVVQAETFGSKRKKNLNLDHWTDNYTNNGVAEIQDYLLAHGTINNTSAVLFRTDIIRKVDPFDQSFRFMGDKYSFIKVLAISDIAYVNRPLNYYRAAADSKPKHTQDYFDYFYEHFLIFDWLTRNLPSLDKLKFKEALKLNTEVSLAYMSGNKLKAFFELFSLNRSLFLLIMKNNLLRSLKRSLGR